MRLLHLDTPAGLRIATADGDVAIVLDLGDKLRTIDDLIAAGPDALAVAAELAARGDATTVSLTTARLAPPLVRPSKILCIGMNYRDHAIEQGIDVPDEPVVFAKLPSSVTGHDAEVAWSPELTNEVDWEVELAVVIGRRLRDAPLAEARDGVFGYTAANDLSARDLQRADGQWVRAKGLDGFLPLGPVIVTADAYGDPSGRRVRSRVNGVLMQDSDTSQLIFGVAEVVSYLSRGITLQPGDLILTGTPAGVGAFRDPPRFLHDGDTVEVDVEGIGLLRTHLREA